MRVNEDEETASFYDYIASWDFVKFDTHCGGFGYLEADISQDCYVDFVDFAMFGEHFLHQCGAN